jgi:hypothetical protein
MEGSGPRFAEDATSDPSVCVCVSPTQPFFQLSVFFPEQKFLLNSW